MRWSRGPCVALPAVAVALAVAAGAAALTPSRTIVASLPVQDLALTGRSVAYVADAPARLQCARIGLWSSRTNRRFLFDSKEQCLEEGSTGQGVWDVAVATNRLLWLTYAGGNFREWSLWTATATKRKPRELHFIARDVDDPAPIVIGPGTAEGIPYAVDRQIVYLGDNGKALFKTSVFSPVRVIAAGTGSGGVRVATLLSSGWVVGLDQRGNDVAAKRFEPRSVAALQVTSLGIAVQVGRDVQIFEQRRHDDVVIPLPSGARMVDFDQGRILWTRAGDLGTTTIATGTSARLVDGTMSQPAYGQLDSRGIVWARGRTVLWRAGALP